MHFVKKVLLKAVSSISFAAATAFFWGASEAVINRFWPPFYIWHPDRLSESAYGRSVFYGALVLTALVIAEVSNAGRNLIISRKEKAGESPPGRYLARPHRRPYFPSVHYTDPHAPYSPPPGYYLPRDEEFVKQYRPGIKKPAVSPPPPLRGRMHLRRRLAGADGPPRARE